MNTYAIDRQKWERLSLREQLGNIGSEVGRTFAAKRRGDDGSTSAALTRALDLFEATASAKGRTFPQLKEILRAKEQFLAALDNPQIQDGLENYFMQFAIAARLHRGSGG